MGPATPPPNHMVLAILSTVCCGCLPLGIVAIVYASQVNSKWAMGDVAGARAASDNAKMWASISIGIGIVLVILRIVLEVAVHNSGGGR